MKLVGRVAEWVGRGIIPSQVARVIVETDRIKDIAAEVSQRIREVISPLPLLRSVVPRFLGPEGLPIGLGARNVFMKFGDVLTNFLAVKTIPLFNFVAFPATVKIIEELEGDPRIRKIYPDRIIRTVQYYPTVPEDGVFKERLTGREFTSTEYTRKIIGAEEANREGYLGRGIRVGVIDTCGAPEHSSIARAIPRTTIRGIWTDGNGHGHHVAATIGGRYYIDPSYNVPTQGMAPECQLFTIKSLGYIIGFGHESDILEAIQLAGQLDLHIVNMSLGSEETPENPEDDPQCKAIKKVVEEKKTIFVVAAGNSGPSERTINSPGISEDVITVGAYNPITGEIAPFSSRGPTPDGRVKPDITMPGVGIYAPVVGILDGLEPPKGALRVSALDGTSMATPHASGLIALMYEHAAKYGIQLTHEMVKDVMKHYGEEREKSIEAGWGVLTWDKWKRYAKEVLGI